MGKVAGNKLIAGSREGPASGLNPGNQLGASSGPLGSRTPLPLSPVIYADATDVGGGWR